MNNRSSDVNSPATWYASPERADSDELKCDIIDASTNPLMTSILEAVDGLLAVLNEQRQIIALNEALLKQLGIADGSTILGLRLGEAVQCIHAHEHVGGCGTSKWCKSCGAAIAIVSALASKTPEERKCLLTVAKDGSQIDLCFHVRAFPLEMKGQKFILLFLQDITGEERMAEFERAFSHDIKNIITCLVNYSGLMNDNESNALEFAKKVQHLSVRLARELQLQEALRNVDFSHFKRQQDMISLKKVFSDVRDFSLSHPAAEGKLLVMPELAHDREIKTDSTVLLRIMSNMVLNALEASQKGDEIKVWAEDGKEMVVVRVWNRQVIPEEVALRVFERHYTTKREPGRGIGTFAMKLLGEKVLGGEVAFTSNEKEGTVFSFSFPCRA